MFGMGAQELMIILVIVLVLFGGSKLPDLAKSLGKSMKEFKKGFGAEGEEEPGSKTQPAVSTTPPPRVCASCKSALEAAWTHCPSCGASAPLAPIPQSPQAPIPPSPTPKV
jgi:sec-independent protein translocase protein TatA